MTKAKLDINTKEINPKFPSKLKTLFISNEIFTTGIIAVVLFKTIVGIMDA